MFYNAFPFFHRLDSRDCVPACLKMIARYYGKKVSLEHLRSKSYITKLGVSMLGISEAAESIGFRTRGVRLNFEALIAKAQLPCIAHWKGNHFIVIYRVKSKRVFIVDPAIGRRVIAREELLTNWASGNDKLRKIINA